MLKCGIDIGGTNIKFGFFENDEKVKFFSIKTPIIKEEIVDAITTAIKKNYKLNNIIGYTVCIPGVIIGGVVTYAPNTNIVGLNLLDDLKTSLQNDNVIIENDANLQALAESKASGLDDLILLTLGTGFGGGIVIDGKLHNKNGFAGEVGHIKVHFGQNSRKCGCGKFGCAEAYVSARAIVVDYNNTMNTSINSKELFDKAFEGDELAKKCIKDCARYLAITIADIVAVLGIKNVRIAGGLSNAGEAFIKEVRRIYPRYSVLNMERISIKKAKLSYQAGVYAAKYLL